VGIWAATGNGTPVSELERGNRVMAREEVRVSFALLLRLSVAMLSAGEVRLEHICGGSSLHLQQFKLTCGSLKNKDSKSTQNASDADS
jgi:hypothetical protein